MKSNLKNQTKQPIKYTSLFANVGIGEYYLSDLGFVCKVANELEPLRAKWLSEHHKSANVIVGDFTNPKIFKLIANAHIENKCEMIMASPVCRDYSTAGKRQIDSHRAFQFEYLLNFIKQVDSVNKYVIIENVPEFLTAKPAKLKGKTVGEYIKRALEKLGYQVTMGILDASQHSLTPQARRRTVILASKTEQPWPMPPKIEKPVTLRAAIGHLPSLKAGQRHKTLVYHRAPNWHPIHVDIMEQVPSGMAGCDVPGLKLLNTDGSPSRAKFKCAFKRRDWDKPCNTILQDSIGVTGFCNCHPGRKRPGGRYSDARALTILELLIVTGLPTNYPIPNWASDTMIRHALGEAFMPLLVANIVKCMPKK